MTEETLGDRIRATRASRNAAIVSEVQAHIGPLKDHIDEHFAKLHARLDELGKQ